MSISSIFIFISFSLCNAYFLENQKQNIITSLITDNLKANYHSNNKKVIIFLEDNYFFYTNSFKLALVM